MPEYIEREAIKTAVRKRLNNSLIIGWLISIINDVPTASVAPVVHGRWVNRFNDSVYECSECGTIGLPCWKGCPECLARMDGE